MKAAMFKGIEDIEIVERDIPRIGSDELLIRVRACGICGSDIHTYLGETTYARIPVILGHEFSGEVVEIGEGVENFKIGDRITIEPNVECGECHFCRKGKIRLCPNNDPYGVRRDGGFAEYCAVRADRAYHIPDDLSYEEAAFSEPISAIVHGIELADIAPADSVAVIGGGPAGFGYIQLAKAVGASPVILITRSHWKYDLARSLGADFVIDPSRGEVKEQILQITNGLGVEVAIEAVGSGETVRQAVDITSDGGKIIIYGVADERDEVKLSPFEILTRELTIAGSWLTPFCFERGISLLSQRTIKVAPLITHRYPLDEIEEGFRTAISKPVGFLKAIVTI